MNLTDLRGEWALVTGASSGIGREFCQELAALGLNLAVVARREARLGELATELAARHGTKTLVIPQDLSAPDAASRIVARLTEDGIGIRLLVNNAAFGHWGRFEAATETTYRDMLQTNVVALVTLTLGLVPVLAARTPSAVVNVASGAAYQPVPFMAVYAASKAFVMSFSQALHGEWKEKGVLVQTLVPGPTESEFDAVAGAYVSAIEGRGSPQQVVRDSLRALERDEPVALNARGTYKQRFFAGLFPPRMVIDKVAQMFRPPSAQG
jgi:uncharacterized protein